MPLDPVDAKRLDDLERTAGELVIAAQRLGDWTRSLNVRLKAVEKREDERRDLWIKVCLALFVLVVGAVFSAGVFIGDMRRAADAGRQIEALEKEFREHLKVVEPKAQAR